MIAKRMTANLSIVVQFFFLHGEKSLFISFICRRSHDIKRNDCFKKAVYITK